MKNTILTGLRANGELHLGNYLGSILPMVQRQRELGPNDELYMFVADLHSFTAPIEHDSLYENVLQNVRMYMAAGVDPEHDRTTLWRQSHVSAHAELAWILNCFTYVGEVNRMVEFKDKSERLGHKAVTVGLFDYPVLMGADILLYHANYIPLGDDQKQHMELIRTIAERFNAKFGDIFTVPEAWQRQVEFTKRQESPRIRSLKHPETKMSKSIDDPAGTIFLLDDPSQAAQKIMSATTDSEGSIAFDMENRPAISNLLLILAAVSERPLAEVCDEWTGRSSYGELKKAVANVVKSFLGTFQNSFQSLSDADAAEVLERGEAHARKVAGKTLQITQQAVGLLR